MGSPIHIPRKIISGGQTGVDQAALRLALEIGLEIGGWCPPGRACESGTVPADLPLVETPRERSETAPQIARSLRTEWNVRDSDATLILRPSLVMDPGTAWTLECTRRAGKPAVVLDLLHDQAGTMGRAWLRSQRPRVLNIAGPSEGSFQGVAELATRKLRQIFEYRGG